MRTSSPNPLYRLHHDEFTGVRAPVPPIRYVASIMSSRVYAHQFPQSAISPRQRALDAHVLLLQRALDCSCHRRAVLAREHSMLMSSPRVPRQRALDAHVLLLQRALDCSCHRRAAVLVREHSFAYVCLISFHVNYRARETRMASKLVENFLEHLNF